MSHARQKRRIARNWERRMIEWAYHLGWLAGDKNEDESLFAMTTGTSAHPRKGVPVKYASWYYDGVYDGANHRLRLEIASIDLDAIEVEESAKGSKS